MKNAYQTKSTPQPQQTLSLPPPPLKLFRHLEITPAPPPWGSNQETKMHMSLKIQFQVVLFYTKLQNFPKKIYPPFQHLQLLIWAPNKKSMHTLLFAFSNHFQNCMTWACRIKNWKVITFQAKGLTWSLPVWGHLWVLPTQKLPGTNLATPECFIPFDPTDEMLSAI